MIDTGLVDPSQPIDLTTLCNTKVYGVNVEDTQYGVNLTDEVRSIMRMSGGEVGVFLYTTSECFLVVVHFSTINTL